MKKKLYIALPFLLALSLLLSCENNDNDNSGNDNNDSNNSSNPINRSEETLCPNNPCDDKTAPNAVPRIAPSIVEFSPSEAAFGATLTLRGENFSAVLAENSVALNGVAANILSARPNEITIEVPQNKHCTGLVSVTTGSQTAVSEVAFTYVPTAFVSTFAGGLPGSNSSSWVQPRGIAIGADGHFYVADTLDYSIRRISPDGESSTFVNGAALLGLPRDIAIDLQGNLYVTDYLYHRIRKISPHGEISTFAGADSSGLESFADGIGSEARFAHPFGMQIDAAGNLYVADFGNHRIRKITPAGEVSTFAGSGTQGEADGIGALAQLNRPAAMAIDAAGNLYVTDSHRIRKITPAGEVSTLAGKAEGGHADGPLNEAEFNNPLGLAIDALGNLYVADTHNNRIRKITPAGEVSTLAGTDEGGGYVDGLGSQAQFYSPHSIAIDTDGNLYVTDYYDKRIRKITFE